MLAGYKKLIELVNQVKARNFPNSLLQITVISAELQRLALAGKLDAAKIAALQKMHAQLNARIGEKDMTDAQFNKLIADAKAVFDNPVLAAPVVANAPAPANKPAAPAPKRNVVVKAPQTDPKVEPEVSPVIKGVFETLFNVLKGIGSNAKNAFGMMPGLVGGLFKVAFEALGNMFHTLLKIPKDMIHKVTDAAGDAIQRLMENGMKQAEEAKQNGLRNKAKPEVDANLPPPVAPSAPDIPPVVPPFVLPVAPRPAPVAPKPTHGFPGLQNYINQHKKPTAPAADITSTNTIRMNR
jgi:hypothetical protein